MNSNQYVVLLIIASLVNVGFAQVVPGNEADLCPGLTNILPLNTASFGPLKEVFNCDVIERQAFSERRPYRNGRSGKETAFWAQEMVGGDMAREYMDKLKRAEGSGSGGVAEVPVGVLDVGFALTNLPRNRMTGNALACRQAVRECNPDAADYVMRGLTLEDIDAMGLPKFGTCPAMTQHCPAHLGDDSEHGTSVSNLILGPPPMASTDQARLSWVDTASRPMEEIVSSFEATTPKPRILNMSIACHLEIRHLCESWPPSIKRISDQTIAVKASGNNFPEEVDPTSKIINGIVVGSLTPSGLASDFSQDGHEVTISAPSDYSIQSLSPRKYDDERPGSRPTLFSGTSGATPMVTSALTNVLALLPDISTAEIKTLLRKTAIPTAGTMNGNNGAGSLNALKLVQVAHRLKEMNLPRSEAKALLNQDSLYDFNDQAQSLVTRAQELMREVPYDANICERHKRAFKLLRQAFFLAPREHNVRKALADIYRANGYEAQADFADPSAGKHAIAMKMADKELRLRALIRSGSFKSSDTSLLREVLQQKEVGHRTNSMLYALLPEHQASLAQALEGLSEEQIEPLYIDLAQEKRMSSEKALTFMQLLLHSPKPAKKNVIFYVFKGLPENMASSVFDEAFRSPNKEDRRNAIDYVYNYCDKNKSVQYLSNLLEHEQDPDLIKQATKLKEKLETSP